MQPNLQLNSSFLLIGSSQWHAAICLTMGSPRRKGKLPLQCLPVSMVWMLPPQLMQHHSEQNWECKSSRLSQTGVGWFQCSSGSSIICVPTWTKHQYSHCWWCPGKVGAHGYHLCPPYWTTSQPQSWFGPLLFMVLALPRADGHGGLRVDTRKLSSIWSAGFLHQHGHRYLPPVSCTHLVPDTAICTSHTLPQAHNGLIRFWNQTT